MRDAALLRTEKVEKQKADVEAARDQLKCGLPFAPFRLLTSTAHMHLHAT